MQAKELRELEIAALRKKELDLREELCRLRMRRGVRQLENSMTLRNTRRELARVLTVMQSAQSGKEVES